MTAATMTKSVSGIAPSPPFIRCPPSGVGTSPRGPCGPDGNTTASARRQGPSVRARLPYGPLCVSPLATALDLEPTPARTGAIAPKLLGRAHLITLTKREDAFKGALPLARHHGQR